MSCNRCIFHHVTYDFKVLGRSSISVEYIITHISRNYSVISFFKYHGRDCFTIFHIHVKCLFFSISLVEYFKFNKACSKFINTNIKQHNIFIYTDFKFYRCVLFSRICYCECSLCTVCIVVSITKISCLHIITSCRKCGCICSFTVFQFNISNCITELELDKTSGLIIHINSDCNFITVYISLCCYWCVFFNMPDNCEVFVCDVGVEPLISKICCHYSVISSF